MFEPSKGSLELRVNIKRGKKVKLKVTKLIRDANEITEIIVIEVE